MLSLIAWIAAVYGACRLLTLPLFLPRRENGRIDTVPFVYVSAVSLVGVIALAVLSYWVYVTTKLTLNPI